MKNIPIPPASTYKKRLIEKVESVIKRMRWKAFFFLKAVDDEEKEPAKNKSKENMFGFKSRKCPPQIEELKSFEDDMLQMTENVRSRKVTDQFQTTLSKDIKKIKNATKMLIPADKTRNFYEIDHALYEKLLRQNITKNYQTTSAATVNKINAEAQAIAAELEIDDRMETMAMKQAFITLKDHKTNFENNLPCRLINPAKSETGLVSKIILDRINNAVRAATAVNQWRSSTAVLEWFRNIQEKDRHTFTSFDIVEFYPSITESLLKKAITFAKKHTQVSKQDIKIVMHARKSLLFDKDTPWKKKDSNELFDVTMGSYDGAEICELVGLYTLSILTKRYGKEKIGLYRDDGLAVFKDISGSRTDSIRKEITSIFKELGLNITIDSNLKITNFLDITLNLNNGKHYPYRKPNDRPMYIHKQSNHPPNIIKNLPASISRRISDISYDEEIFKKASPAYIDALKSSGYTEGITYLDKQPTKKKRNRQRNVIWFNPPFSNNVTTNIGATFLKLINKHFPKKSKLNKIFNRNTVKISYSCMPNIASIIKAHNKQISTSGTGTDPITCNCRKKDLCPLQGNCQATNIIYNAEVKENNNSQLYIGLTEPPFKLRYNNHTQSFKHEKHQNSTELSKHIWQLKRNKKPFTINWSIASRAQSYNSESKRCNLCLTEKLHILNAEKHSLLNKRPELISKCRHENKFYLRNFKRDNT